MKYLNLTRDELDTLRIALSKYTGEMQRALREKEAAQRECIARTGREDVFYGLRIETFRESIKRSRALLDNIGMQLEMLYQEEKLKWLHPDSNIDTLEENKK